MNNYEINLIFYLSNPTLPIRISRPASPKYSTLVVVVKHKAMSREGDG